MRFLYLAPGWELSRQIECGGAGAHSVWCQTLLRLLSFQSFVYMSCKTHKIYLVIEIVHMKKGGPWIWFWCSNWNVNVWSSKEYWFYVLHDFSLQDLKNTSRYLVTYGVKYLTLSWYHIKLSTDPPRLRFRVEWLWIVNAGSTYTRQYQLVLINAVAPQASFTRKKWNAYSYPEDFLCFDDPRLGETSGEIIAWSCYSYGDQVSFLLRPVQCACQWEILKYHNVIGQGSSRPTHGTNS